MANVIQATVQAINGMGVPTPFQQSFPVALSSWRDAANTDFDVASVITTKGDPNEYGVLETVDNLTTAANGGDYKVYAALLSQSGINAPTIIILQNTLDEIPFSEYNSTGQYDLAFPIGSFDAAKTAIFTSGTNGGTTFNGFIQNGVCQLITRDSTTSDFINNALNHTAIEIRVYQ